jgi:hypothetical protein
MDALGARSTLFCKLISNKLKKMVRAAHYSAWRGQNPLVQNKIYLFDSVWQAVTLCGIFYWFKNFPPTGIFPPYTSL